MSEVVIVRSEYDRLLEAFAKIFKQTGSDIFQQAGKIAIKINLCDYRPPETGATTHPKFLDAFLDWTDLHAPHSEIYVVESDASRARPDLIRNWLGISSILDKHGAEWVNLSKDKWTRKSIQGLKFHSFKVPETLAHSDLIISMAKLKTHSLTAMSGSLKNMFGCIMTSRKTQFHDFLDEAIVDACTAIRPGFSIVDGIIGMGGPKGPVDGVPIHAGVILAGLDPVGVDAACATILGLNPHHIRHLRCAQAIGLGSMEFTPVPDGIPHQLPNFETNEIYRWILKAASTMQRRSISWG